MHPVYRRLSGQVLSVLAALACVGSCRADLITAVFDLNPQPGQTIDAGGSFLMTRSLTHAGVSFDAVLRIESSVGPLSTATNQSADGLGAGPDAFLNPGEELQFTMTISGAPIGGTAVFDRFTQLTLGAFDPPPGGTDIAGLTDPGFLGGLAPIPVSSNPFDLPESIAGIATEFDSFALIPDAASGPFTARSIAARFDISASGGAAVPEPSSFALLAFGLTGGLSVFRCRRRRRSVTPDEAEITGTPPVPQGKPGEVRCRTTAH